MLASELYIIFSREQYYFFNNFWSLINIIIILLNFGNKSTVIGVNISFTPSIDFFFFFACRLSFTKQYQWCFIVNFDSYIYIYIFILYIIVLHQMLSKWNIDTNYRWFVLQFASFLMLYPSTINKYIRIYAYIYKFYLKKNIYI